MRVLSRSLQYFLQKQDSDALAPVTYYSQSTNEAETRYHSFLEMLAIVKATERFHIYLAEISFKILIITR